MIAERYYKQVALLLRVLPEISRFKELALHGGTAINLFVRDMPRLSVDIDLTYLPLESRRDSLHNIIEILTELKARVQKVVPGIRVVGPAETGAEYKLFCQHNGVMVKLEVNTTIRGVIDNAVKLPLNNRAQEAFDVFAEVQVVPMSQLMGGKIVAALDRQHPRDLFDVKLLLENEGLNSAYVKGLMFGILSSNRPVHELLDPALEDQSQVLEDQFTGMSAVPFTYEQYEQTRRLLLHEIFSRISENEKALLTSFTAGEPVWEAYDFSAFPSVKWKLQNIQNLRKQHPSKFAKQLDALKRLI